MINFCPVKYFYLFLVQDGKVRQKAALQTIHRGVNSASLEAVSQQYFQRKSKTGFFFGQFFENRRKAQLLITIYIGEVLPYSGHVSLKKAG